MLAPTAHPKSPSGIVFVAHNRDCQFSFKQCSFVKLINFLGGKGTFSSELDFAICSKLATVWAALLTSKMVKHVPLAPISGHRMALLPISLLPA